MSKEHRSLGEHIPGAEASRARTSRCPRVAFELWTSQGVASGVPAPSSVSQGARYLYHFGIKEGSLLWIWHPIMMLITHLASHTSVYYRSGIKNIKNGANIFGIK